MKNEELPCNVWGYIHSSFFTLHFSDFPLIGIAVIRPVGQHDVVYQADIHDGSALRETFRQTIVVRAGTHVARRMIVTERNGRRTAQQSLTKHQAYVD